MAAESNVSPLIVIVGTTASGKSSLAVELARKYQGEIICADSRTVYKGMDIGTAKPTVQDQQEIPHHLLDVVTPDLPYSAAKFKEAAVKAIEDVSNRGKLPFLVGGTGLYIDSVIYDFAFLPPGSLEDREHLQALSVEELQKEIRARGLPMPENSKNSRHLIRAIETNGAVAVRKRLRPNTLIIGLDRSKEDVVNAIHTRTKAMIDAGLANEVESLVETYGWDSPGLQAVGYREWRENEAIEKIIRAIEVNSARYAKRQRTWFKRNLHIHWIKNVADAETAIKKFLQK